MLFTDETQVVLGKSKNISVWRKADEKWRPECLNILKRPVTASVMFWGCVTYNGVGVLVPVEGNINSAKYIDILDTNLWPVVAKSKACLPQATFL